MRTGAGGAAEGGCRISDEPPRLFDPDEPDDRTIQARFEAFHLANPEVFTALERLTEQWVSRGRKRLGIGMLWEVLRWQTAMQTADPSSDFKLNDHYRSRYVRLLIARHPDWAGVFELRELRSA